MTTRYNVSIQELFDVSNEAAKLVEERLVERLAAWFDARKLCRTSEASRRLAEKILSGDLEALADD